MAEHEQGEMRQAIQPRLMPSCAAVVKDTPFLDRQR